MRAAVLIAIFVILGTITAKAGEQKLSGTEIIEALSGKTAFGTQKGTPWKQFFDPNGATTFISGDDAPSTGRWQIQGDAFCSLWPPSGDWDCYDMTGAGDQVTWIYQGGGDPWPAKMVDGNQLQN
ncbi:MAG: hypothetical protein AAF530_06320 [Pseudomonadota bacterium]